MLVVSKFMIIPHITLENHSKFSHGALYFTFPAAVLFLIRFFLFPLMENMCYPKLIPEKSCMNLDALFVSCIF